MASIPCTVQLSTRTTTSRRLPSMGAQGPGKGEAAAGGELRTPLLGAPGVSSSMPHSGAGKAKKKGNVHIVEAVGINIKRSNPLRGRLSKLGFPKLSGMFA